MVVVAETDTNAGLAHGLAPRAAGGGNTADEGKAREVVGEVGDDLRGGGAV